MEDLKQKSIKAFVWDFSGKIANQFVSFIVSIFLARLLSPEDFGMLAMINVIIMLSSGFINMGLGEALIQKKNINDKHYGSVFFFNIVVGITLSGLLFVFAPLIGKFYNNSDLIPITRTMSLLFIFNSFGNVIRIKLQKELNYGIPAKAGFISSFISGIIGIAMAFTGFGVWSLVVQSLLNPVIANFYLFSTVKWKPVLQFKWHALKDLWDFGFRMFLSGIINTIFVNIDSVIIGKLFSPETLGFYYRARSLNNYIVQYSSASLKSVLFPTLSKVQDNIIRFKSIVQKSYHLIATIAFFLTGFFFVTGSDFIILLFGEKWLPAVSYFQIIIISGYAYPLNSLQTTILSASGNSKSFLKLEIIKKTLSGISLALGFIWGITGFLILKTITTLINFQLNLFFAGKQMKTGYFWFLKMILPYFFITVFLAGSLFLFKNQIQTIRFFRFLISGTLFSVFYLFFLLFFKVDGIFILWSEIRNFKLFNHKFANFDKFISNRYKKDKF